MSEAATLKQKRRFHAMVRDIARQVPWAGEMMDEHEWKLLIFAGAYGQDVVPNPIGEGFVIRNKRRVRSLDKSGDLSMADLITQLVAFGNERGVQWSDPEWQALLAEGRV